MNGPIHHFRRSDDAANPFPETGERPRVGVIYNPRSHRNKGRDLGIAERPEVMVAQPAKREGLKPALAEFARTGIDYLVINGGDGTVRDVLTCGESVFGNHWPEIAVLPKGKTNALNADLGAPADWSLAEALDAYANGRRVIRHPMAIAPADGAEDAVLGFILGAGAFTIGIDAGQDAHRMGAFNSLAVAVTTGWGALQVLFGTNRNRWRRGVGAKLVLHEDGAARELPHSRHGARSRRGMLFASTLEGFPLGARPFADEEGPIRIAALDTMRRRLMAFLPLILTGYNAPWLARAGAHRASAENLHLTLDACFILDGEKFAAGDYTVRLGPEIRFVVP